VGTQSLKDLEWSYVVRVQKADVESGISRKLLGSVYSWINEGSDPRRQETMIKTFIKNNLKFKFRMEESFEEIPKVSKTK